MTPSDSAPTIVAAVDLGSNSFHMIICSLNDGKLQIVDKLKESVRLAAGLDEQLNLNSETQERALACLKRFGQRIKDFPDNCVSIVGTNTLRTAQNSAEFLALAQQNLGHPIHIISGIEEARLIYQGVATSLGSNVSNRFVMDIGGGSTEYIIGSGSVAHTKESLHLGCVTFSKLFFTDGSISKRAFKAAVLLGQQRLEPFQNKFNRKNWDESIGASGSLKAINNVLTATGWSNNGITLEGLEKLIEYICQCKHVDELDLPELSQDRAIVFPAGVAIIYATFKALKIEQMTISDGALREGLIHDLLGRMYNHDIRSETSRTLAQHYRSDLDHADAVKQTALYIFRQLKDLDALLDNPASEQFLSWAAELHEIGLNIAHSQYQKHSAYIIENGDLAGFSKQDQAVLGAIVKTHRKKFALSRFEKLPGIWPQTAPVLTIILRIAVLLNRSRMQQRPAFSIDISNKQIVVKFADNWLQQAPLTEADMKLEASYLGASAYQLEYC